MYRDMYVWFKILFTQFLLSSGQIPLERGENWKQNICQTQKKKKKSVTTEQPGEKLVSVCKYCEMNDGA